MQYMIVVYGHRLAGYGPFDSENDARNHADKYFQDFRTEIIPYQQIGFIDTSNRISKELAEAFTKEVKEITDANS